MDLKLEPCWSSSWRRLGVILGMFWRRLGGVLGRLEGVLGASWGVLGASWGVLGASWDVSKASRACPGASPNRSETLQRPPDRFLSDFGSIFHGLFVDFDSIFVDVRMICSPIFARAACDEGTKSESQKGVA